MLVWSLWLALPVLCWIREMKADILVLFLILKRTIVDFAHWVWCWRWVCHIWPLLCLSMFPLFPLWWEFRLFLKDILWQRNGVTNTKENMESGKWWHPRRMGKRNPRMRATDQSAKAQGAILLYGIGGWRMEGRRLFNTPTYHCTTQQHTMIEWRV